jgi:hypothetical protein
MNAKIERMVNSENLGSRLKDVGSRSFQGWNSLFKRFWAGICRVLEWLEGLGTIEQGLLQCLGIFVEFWRV